MSNGRLLTAAFVLFQLPLALNAQVSPDLTRFTVTAAPSFLQPTGVFSQNISNGFGAGGGVLYHLDRAGVFSARFDISGERYGIETKRVPISETVGQRVLVNLSTANWITAFSFGPEVALPRGFLRPYGNAGFSRLLLRTSSSVNADSSSENPIARTVNYSDSTNALFLGGGLRVPIAAKRSHNMISLDLGVRYLRGGAASYLREGSIQDGANGSTFLTPISSRTPHMIYLAGIRVRIPHDPAHPCPHFLC